MESAWEWWLRALRAEAWQIDYAMGRIDSAGWPTRGETVEEC